MNLRQNILFFEDAVTNTFVELLLNTFIVQY